MNKNSTHLILSAVAALLLLTFVTSASAATRLVCWKGQAWQSSDGGETWTEAGGCAGGPWAIEYAMEPYEEPSDMTSGEVLESLDTYIDESLAQYNIGDEDASEVRVDLPKL